MRLLLKPGRAWSMSWHNPELGLRVHIRRLQACIRGGEHARRREAIGRRTADCIARLWMQSMRSLTSMRSLGGSQRLSRRTAHRCMTMRLLRLHGGLLRVGGWEPRRLPTSHLLVLLILLLLGCGRNSSPDARVHGFRHAISSRGGEHRRV
jgi:hypothetical protein